MKKRIISTICILLCVLLTGCGSTANYEDVPELITPVGKSISETEVVRTDLYTTTVINGEVIPNIREYAFKTTGRVNYVYVKVGDYVKKGDILAEVESTAAQAEISEIEEKIKEISNHYDYEIKKLQDEKNKPGATWQLKELNDLIISQYEALKEEKVQILEELMTPAKEKLLRTKIIAEESGRVTAMNCSLNRTAYQDNPAFAVANESDHTIICDAVSAELLSSANKVFTLKDGKIYSVNFLRNDSEETPQYSYFELPGVALTSGDYAPIIIISDLKEDVVAVPNDCLYVERDEYYVYVIAEGTRVKKKITVGFAGLNYTEVVDGLNEGDKVYIKEESSSTAHSVEAKRGDFAITTKVKAKANYNTEKTLYAERLYGYLYFGGFNVKLNQKCSKGDVIAKYSEYVDDDFVAETYFSLEYAKMQKDAESIAYYENVLEEINEAVGERKITAPCDGMVISMSELYTGSPIWGDNKVCVFAGLDNLLFSVDNSKNDFRYGQTVLVEAMVNGKEEKCTGKVITASATGLSGNLKQKTALIELDEGYEALYFSNSVFISVNTIAVEDVIMIPIEAAQSVSGQMTVLVNENGEMKRVRFVNGRKGQTYYWAADGLYEGQQLFY